MVPGLDINSTAYKRAVQLLTGPKHVHFAPLTPEHSKASQQSLVRHST